MKKMNGTNKSWERYKEGEVEGIGKEGAGECCSASENGSDVEFEAEKGNVFSRRLRNRFPILERKDLYNTFLGREKLQCAHEHEFGDDYKGTHKHRFNPSVSLMKCSCGSSYEIQDQLCRNCVFIQRLQDNICNTNASHVDLDNRCIFAGPHPLDAMMSWYHFNASSSINSVSDDRHNSFKDLPLFSWMNDDVSGNKTIALEQTLTISDLYECAFAVSYLLQQRLKALKKTRSSATPCPDARANTRARVVICMEPSLEFICAFMGCLLAGAIAIPIYPEVPSVASITTRSQPTKESRIKRVILDSGATIAITSSKYMHFVYLMGMASTFSSITSNLKTRINPNSKPVTSSKWDGGITWLAITISNLKETFRTIIKPVMRAASEVGDECQYPFTAMKPFFLCRKYDLDDIAFLQYTSGSTRKPKAVVVTHRALVHNISQLLCVMSPLSSYTSCEVSWLPQYHDMGLIGSILVRIAMAGGQCVLFSPLLFIRKPLVWVTALSHFQATHTGGPDFAYALAVRREIDRLRRRGKNEKLCSYDLSRLQFALIGGERVRASTLNSLLSTFKDSGLRECALVPSYGLAECCVYVSNDRGINVTVNVNYDMSSKRVRNFVSVGLPHPGFGVNLCVVNYDRNCSENHEKENENESGHYVVEDGAVGEVWIKSDSLAAGYWNCNHGSTTQHENYSNPFESKLRYCSQARTKEFINWKSTSWLRSGDLGVMLDVDDDKSLTTNSKSSKRLYIVGRMKDVIVVRGRNIHPDDVEEIVLETDSQGLHDGHLASMSSDNQTLSKRPFRIRRTAAVPVFMPSHATSTVHEDDLQEDLAIVVETDIEYSDLKKTHFESYRSHAKVLQKCMSDQLNASAALIIYLHKNR